jgi:hypothetical protein
LAKLGMVGDLQVVDASIDVVAGLGGPVFDHRPGYDQPPGRIAWRRPCPTRCAAVDAYVIAFGLRNVTDFCAKAWRRRDGC